MYSIARNWLLVLLFAAMAGCSGGGAFTPATEGDTTTGLPVAGGTDTRETATVEARGTFILPPGVDSTEIAIVTLDEGGGPVPNVTLAASVTGVGTVDNANPVTGLNGEAIVKVNRTGDGEAILTVATVVSSGTVGVKGSIFFGAVVSANLVNNGQVADGQSEVTVQVRAQDASGAPLVAIPSSLSFSPGSFAIPVSQVTETDQNGLFVVGITNTVPYDATEITPIIGGYRVEPALTPTFVPSPSSGSIPPVTLDLIVANSPAAADGSTEIQLIVIARDSTGAPLSDVSVSLSSSSSTAVLANVVGTTGSEAKFETSISNTVEENVTITVTAPNLSAQTTVQFRNDSTNATVSSIRTTLAGNNSYANGKDAAILTVEALNSEGIAVTDADVAFKISSPDLTMNSETGTTTGGRFTSQLTSAQAGSYTVTPIVGGILYTNQAQTINFIAIGGEVSPVSSIEISADTLTQVADGSSSVNLTAIARNANNTPIKDVNIYLTSTSGTALLGTSTGTTGENGAFQTTLSNTQIESVTIGAFTDNFTNPGNTHLIKIEFTPAQDNPGAEPTDIRLDIENNNAQANGTDKIALHVVVFGENGIRLSGVTADFDIQEKANETPPLFVFDGSSSGKTNDNGVFTAYLTSTTPGTILITAKGNNTDDDEVKEVTFSEATTDRPAQLILLADSVELQSDNTAEGVVLTVQLKTGGNNPFPNQIVNFSASSGVIQPIPASDGDTAGESNATGLVKARLTTGGDPANRDIQVMAVVDGEAACTAADKDSHPLCDIVDIKVVGTQITIDGPENIGQDTNNVYTLTLSNANGQGIADKTLTVALKSGSSNSLDQTSVNTDSTGKATVILTVPPAQTDTTETLTVAGINVNASKSVNISTDDFAVTLDANTDANLISLGRPAIFTIDWPQGALGTVVISTTRGLVKKSGGDPNDPNACDTSQADWHSTQEVVLTPLGGGNFTVCSDNPGHAAITVNAVNGPSMEFALNFVAKNPDKISLQASPSTIGTNTPGSENESMEIIGIVRNAENSVVANATVSFTVHDSTGGYMSPPVAVTDQFGRVTSSYIAGGIPSPFEGVEITANVNNSSAQDTIKVTVGKRSVFISLGTGNELFEPTPTTYERPYTIFVNDANGAAVSDMDVNLSIIPLRYFKGFYRLSEDGWFAQYTAPASTDPVLDGSGCINEDSNNNGILDPGEDENNNGKLEPGNPFILPEAVRTDENGQATFNLSYTQEIANWVKVRLIAKSVVSGTENSAIVEVLPSGIASDFGVDTAPPGRRGTIQKSDYPPEFFPNQDGSIQVIGSPYGFSYNCDDAE